VENKEEKAEYEQDFPSPMELYYPFVCSTDPILKASRRSVGRARLEGGVKRKGTREEFGW
jgi:hypothetical protein